jgi:hypothetical protein
MSGDVIQRQLGDAIMAREAHTILFGAEPDNPFEANAELPMGILSPSSVSCFMRCPEQFRREYVKREKRAMGAWGASGTAFHDARHKILKWQETERRALPAEEVEAFYTDAWDALMKGDEGETIEWRGTTAEAQHALGLGMLREYHATLGAEVVPIRMEFGAKAYVEGVPVPVYGRVDVETSNEIIDTKTGKNLVHKIKPEWYVQGCVYCLITGKSMRWHSVSQKPAAATNDGLTVSPRPKVLNAARAYVRGSYEGIVYYLRTRGPDEEWPGTGPAAGTCNYCSFRSRCLYVPD